MEDIWYFGHTTTITLLGHEFDMKVPARKYKTYEELWDALKDMENEVRKNKENRQMIAQLTAYLQNKS